MVHARRGEGSALSADGYDINFATNTLGPHALTLALEPLLLKSAPARVRGRLLLRRCFWHVGHPA